MSKKTGSAPTEIAAAPCPTCYVCGSAGGKLYEGMQDRLFDAPGFWDLKKCTHPKCGLIWLDPMPTKEDIGKAYSSYYTHGGDVLGKSWLNKLSDSAVEGYLAVRYEYSRLNLPLRKKILGLLLFLHPGRKADADFSVMWLKSIPGGRLLEVGSGSGVMLKHLQELGWDVQGVDFDPWAVKTAKEKGVKVNLGSLEEQDFPEASFDAVIMSHLIEHVHDPVSLLAASRRVLKAGGKLTVVTPNNRSLWHKLFGHHWMSLDPPRHLNLFSVDALRTLTERAGFQKIEVRTVIRDANGIFVGSRSIKRTGRHDMERIQPLMMRIYSRWAQIFEWIAQIFFPESGEDILLIAEKIAAARPNGSGSTGTL